MSVAAARALAVVLVLVPASASAGAGAARPPVAVTVSPARVALAGTARTMVEVRNTGSSRVVVDISRAGFALDLRGRPRVVGGTGDRRSAAGWITVTPRTVAIRPGRTAKVSIASTIPARAQPGDHDSLVLVTTRRRMRDGVAVRMRMGVVVVVRAPGKVVRRLRLGALRVAGSGRSRALEALVANRGNVTEAIERSEASVSLFAGGRRVARLLAEPRELRPGTRGLLRFRYAARRRGLVTARVTVLLDSGRVLQRSFRLRL
jgi:hypothetical protein